MTYTLICIGHLYFSWLFVFSYYNYKYRKQNGVLAMQLTKSFEWFHDGQITITVEGDWIEGESVRITLSNGKTVIRKVRFDSIAHDLSFTLEKLKFFLMDFND